MIVKRWYNPANYPLAAGDQIKSVGGMVHVVGFIGRDSAVVTTSKSTGETCLFTPVNFKATFKGVSYE